MTVFTFEGLRERPRVRDNARGNRCELRRERSAVVVLAVFLTDLTNLRRRVGVPQRRHGGKQVVLDLMAQVPAHEMKPRTTGEIAGAADLPQIPGAAAFVL